MGSAAKAPKRPHARHTGADKGPEPRNEGIKEIRSLSDRADKGRCCSRGSRVLGECDPGLDWTSTSGTGQYERDGYRYIKRRRGAESWEGILEFWQLL